MKIRAVMYGTSEESEGSCVVAVDETDLWPETRYLASDSHFRLSASVPGLFEPQVRDNGAAVTVADGGMVRVKMVVRRWMKFGFMICLKSFLAVNMV